MSARVLLFAALLLAAALAGCFGGDDEDDDDTLLAEVEREGWDVTVVGADGTQRTYHVTSDPGKEDTDRDGLDDDVELLERTDPRKPDTDGDGLLDGEDMVLGADDGRVDTWKGLGIRWEETEDRTVRFLGERGDGHVARGGLPTRVDTDADGIVDGDEAAGFEIDIPGRGPTQVKTQVFSRDTDGEGVFDGAERDLGLDPTRQDTDGDGTHDGGDINPWYDVQVRFEVIDLDLMRPGDAEIWLLVQGLDPLNPRSDTVRAADAQADPGVFDLPTLDPGEIGGSVVQGRHNVSFLVHLFEEGEAGPTQVDLFSSVTGDPWVEAQVHALDGTLTWRAEDGSFRAFPDAGFEGEDGSIRFQVPLVSPPGPMREA